MGRAPGPKWALVAAGFVPVGLAGAAAAFALGSGATTGPVMLGVRVGFVVALGMSAAAIAGYYAWTDALPATDYGRVFWRTATALLVWVAIAGVAVLSTPTVDPASWQGWEWGWTLSLWLLVGATIGLVLSVREARTVERARIAERERVRRNRLEAEHERLTFINRLLRHNLLNGLNVISGHASLLKEEFEETPDELETIRERCEVMVDHIQDVRRLMQATVDDVETGPVDLSETLEREVDRLQDEFEEAEVERSIHPTVHVVADDLLGSVFENLLQNAVEHNDAETPRVTVRATVGSETATVRIADNGPGIPEDRREQLNEYDFDNATLGLYLVATLVTRYGGDIDFSDNTPRGTVVTVDLPLAHTSDERDQNPDLAEAGAAARSLGPSDRGAVDARSGTATE